jgi:hypothetical protein
MRVILLLVACAFVAQAEAAPRPGKVVRIERKARRFWGEPRWCGVSLETMQAFCYGKQPPVGANVAVMDMNHTIGVFQADKVDPLGACKGAQNTLWTVHLKGDPPTQTVDTNIAGLIDVTIDPRVAKLVRVDEAPGSRPSSPEQMTGFDLDGDDRADLAVASFTCDDNGDPVTALSVAGGTPDQCLEMWYANGHGFEKLRTDRIGHNCF